jgi:glycosyltransferase involved in cell wall biosynthesis
MNRLIQGLRAAGLNARVVCRSRTRDDSVEMPRSGRSERLLGAIATRCGLNDVHRFSAFKLLHDPAYQDADVIDFHCIHHGAFNYLALPRATAAKPAVLTLHDMWPFTGHCHNSLDCERWRHGCGRCPYPDVEPAIRRDATSLDWRLKSWAYRRSRLVVVSPSRWLAALAAQSMLSRFPIHHVPHGIDTGEYRPLDADQCRAALGIPSGGKVLLCVADKFSRRLKGGDLLLKALERLPSSLKQEVTLLLLGMEAGSIARSVDIPTVDLGFLTSDRLKVLAYCAADLLVHPTRADNFPLVVLESLACGTPVVSFRVGGVPELVRPGVTGWLAEPEDADGLRDGIAALLSDRPGLHRLRHNCRRIALAEYSLDLQAQRYIDIYRGVVQMAQAIAPAPIATAYLAAEQRSTR